MVVGDAEGHRRTTRREHVCPHRGGPLADGLADDRVVVCPLHGYTYDLCTGVETTGSDTPVPGYDATLDADGTVRVNVGQCRKPHRPHRRVVTAAPVDLVQIPAWAIRVLLRR